jgi:hypothetical protein
MGHPSKKRDEAFISAWHASGGSPTRLSEQLGISLRAIYLRRDAVEARHGIALVANSPKAVKHDPAVTRAIMSARRDVNRIEISDGVVLVGSDAHYTPEVIPMAHKALCNLIVDLGSEVKAVVLNGDILDGGSISRHPRIRWKKPPSVKEELDAVIARTGDIERAVRPGTHLFRTYGNHCARFESRLSSQVPEYEGIGGFTLRDHLPRWADSDRIDVNEDMVILHDWHAGIHSGWNDVLKGGCHTVTGHTHELGTKAHRGFKGTHYGIKTGMLADNDQKEFDYRLGKPGLNWQSGFAVLTWRNGVLLHPEFCAVRDDGNAYFRGKLYAD